MSKEIKKHQMRPGESYLIYTGYQWSPSGYDIAEYISNGELISQSNGGDINEKCKIIKVYKLPEND